MIEMIRQLSRLILFILMRLGGFILKHPGASLGFAGGALIGFVLGSSMVRFGFPGWVLPVNTLMWAVATAPVVRNYFQRLR